MNCRWLRRCLSRAASCCFRMVASSICWAQPWCCRSCSSNSDSKTRICESRAAQSFSACLLDSECSVVRVSTSFCSAEGPRNRHGGACLGSQTATAELIKCVHQEGGGSQNSSSHQGDLSVRGSRCEQGSIHRPHSFSKAFLPWGCNRGQSCHESEFHSLSPSSRPAWAT